MTEDAEGTASRSAYIVGAAVVLLISSALFYAGLRLVQTYYEAMRAYHVDGMPVMLLIALGIAIVATPFFAASAAQGPGNGPGNLYQVMQLYATVLGIVFVSLSVVFFALWILGWLRVLLYVAWRKLTSFLF